ncbi:MAG: ABC-2 family transporter protein [bacterium]
MKEYINKAWAILLYSWKDFFEYRGYLLFWIVMGSQSFFIMYFLWMFVYRDNQIVSGFTLSAMITYYFVAYFVKEFTSTYFDWNIMIKINDGLFSHFFYRPMTHRMYYMFHNIGEKTVRFIVFTPVLLFLYFLIKDYFIEPVPGAWPYIIISFILSFFMTCYFTFIMGYTAFWTEKSETIIYFKDSLVFYLSGAMVPLALFGEKIANFLKLLPFRYFISFPIEIYLGKLTGLEMSQGFLVAFTWLIVLIILERLIFKKGAKRFSAVGN